MISIPWLQCALKYLHERNFDLLGLFPVIELFQSFKGFITYVYTVILSCMLFLKHGQILGFLSIYFQTNILTSDDQSFCIFFTVCF